MRFSTDGGTNWTAWEPFATAKNLTLPDQDGVREVRLELRDLAGNIATFSDSVTVDRVLPTGSIVINNDAALATSLDVALALTGADLESGLDAMRFSTDEGINWSEWEPFATAKNLTLPDQDGTREVRLELGDLAGNVATFSDTILLDRPPTGTIVINNGSSDTNSPNVTLILDVTDVLTEDMNIQMSFSEDGVNFAPVEPFASSKDFTLTGPDGTKTVTVRYQDEAGNTVDASDDIVLNTIPPVPVTFEGDAHIDTSQFKFGGGSLALDGNGDYLSIPDSEDWDFGEGPFTIDFQIRFATVSGELRILDVGKFSSFSGVAFAWEPNIATLSINGATTSRAWSPSANVWYHVAIIRTGAIIKIFIDGTQIGADITDSSNIQAGATGINIGRYMDGTTYHFNGWMDEFRISKGTARWAANFTPPTQEYPSDSDTKLLLHLNS
ncbi:MAG: LamG domain-containing protein [Candidatus Omnitrophica bacterium]|nr:LamG domain-containing protein [Candidatus Omnitrophota bacterium]